jgi:hypothetical protein
MAQICIESQNWITENVSKPVDTWVTQAQTQCSSWPWPFNWLCTVVTFLIRVIVWIVEIVMRLVAVVICIIAFIVNLWGFVLNLIFSIPGIGRILKLVLNWALELFLWRPIGAIEGLASVGGTRNAKKMSLKLIILKDENGVPLTTEERVLPHIRKAQKIYKERCNVDLAYRGACVPDLNAPTAALDIDGDPGSIVSNDLGTRGSYYEFVSSTCAFDGGFFRVIGYGADIIVIIVRNVTLPGGTGTSHGVTPPLAWDYLMLPLAALTERVPIALAHEIGHACGLDHVDDPSNLMMQGKETDGLYDWQIAGIRTSRHCVYV